MASWRIFLLIRLEYYSLTIPFLFERTVLIIKPAMHTYYSKFISHVYDSEIYEFL
jgi:hypothetical protein